MVFVFGGWSKYKVQARVLKEISLPLHILLNCSLRYKEYGFIHKNKLYEYLKMLFFFYVREFFRQLQI